MSVDIYGFIEIKKENQWILAETPERYIYKDFDIHLHNLKYEFGDTIIKPKILYFETNRNFVINLQFLFPESKGLPLDLDTSISNYIQREQNFGIYNNDGPYNFNWLLIDELINANWDELNYNRIKFGYVKKELANLFNQNNSVYPFPSKAWPKNETIYDYQSAFKNLVFISWTDTFRKTTGETYLERLFERLKKFGNPKHTRLIYFNG